MQWVVDRGYQMRVIAPRPISHPPAVRAATKKYAGGTEMAADGSHLLKGIAGDTGELSINIKPTTAKEFGVSVFCDKEGKGFPIAIKLEGKGPIIFAQKRHGFNNDVFQIFKFRTMVVQEDGEEIVQV